MKDPDDRAELLKGTLDLLILQVLSAGAAHGYAIAERIKARSRGELLVEEGSLYPALHRLHRLGHLKADWGVSENNRRARFYSLSRSGRKELERRVRGWRRLSSAVSRVLRPAAVAGPVALAHPGGGA